MTNFCTILPSKRTLLTGHEVRLAARANDILSTSGLASKYLQTNLIVLPMKYAEDFRLLCARNPVPCPLLAESEGPGVYNRLKYHVKVPTEREVIPMTDIDIRTDAPRFMVYRNGVLLKHQVQDVLLDWHDDHIAFLIGCSYSFEAALAAAGLTPHHTLFGRVVPMYRTQLPLHPAGIFTGSTVVVSMRPYPHSAIETVRAITRPYTATHGEPLAWGWDALQALGIQDVNMPTWGEAPVTLNGKSLMFGDEDNVPVFWGCGVTPQEAVMKAKVAGTVIGHAPGHMIVLDLQDDDLLRSS